MELWAVMDWSFEIQWRVPFSQRMYSDTDRDLKRSRCLGGMDGLVSEASWGPQLALVSSQSLFGGRGKLRKAEISFDF